MVPNGWESKPLVKLLDKIIDYRGQSVPKASSGIPLITAKNVRDGYLDFSSQEYLNESKFEEWMSRGIPSKGDILFTTEAPLGKACRYPSNGQFAVGQRTVTLRTNDDLDSEFLLYTLLSERGQRLIDIRSSGSTAKGIKSSELKKVKISYPESLPEQRKIAKILSTWDKAIATIEKLIESSKQQKKALMQQLLTGKKRLVNPDTGKAFQGEWEEVKLGDAVHIGRGFAFKSGQYASTGSKIVRVTNIASSGNIDLSDCVFVPKDIASEYQKYALKNEDVLLVMVGATAGKLGFVTPETLPSLLNQNMWSLRTKDNYALHQSFLKQIAEQIVSRYMLTQQGSARGFFTQSTFELVKFSIPVVEEQQKIASVLAAADKEIEVFEAKLAHFKQEKKALMQQLLTGKRRVKVDDKEIA